MMAAPDAAARPCLIFNPLSFRASRRGLAGRVATLAASQGFEVRSAGNPGEFRAVLDDLRGRNAGQIWMLAGDGTVHATAQYLAQPGHLAWSPALLLLGGGRANVVPRDCGGYPAWPRFTAALAARKAGTLREEQLTTLRVEQDGADPQHGFFLAGGVIYAGIRYCQQFRAEGDDWLRRSWLADPFCLLKIAAGVWAGRSPLPAYEDLLIRADGIARMRAPVRLLLVSTLQMREALYNPFASRGQGPVRLTAVAADAKHFWRRLTRMFKGRFGEEMDEQQGYLSGRFAGAEVLGLDGYALDGELFATDPARPVRFGPGISLRILRT